MASAPIEGQVVLDRAYEALNSEGMVYEEMDQLVDGLARLRRRAHPDTWDEFCKVDCVTHPVRFLVHQDPLTERAYFKPRGFPGDAVQSESGWGSGSLDMMSPPAWGPAYGFIVTG